MEKLKEEIIAILIRNQREELNSVTGERTGEVAVYSDSYTDVANEIVMLLKSVTDPENQPNQFGIIL